MGCCGQKRAKLSIEEYPSAESSGSTATLRYLGSDAILVRGAATGRHYQFSGGHPVQNVDPRDARMFLHTHLFVQHAGE